MKPVSVILSVAKAVLNIVIGSIFILFCLFGYNIAINSFEARGFSPLPVRGIIMLVLAAVWLALIVIQLITKKLKFVEPLFFFTGLCSSGVYIALMFLLSDKADNILLLLI